jgi:head-tail adaptor
MQAGRFDTRVTVLRRTLVNGEPTGPWVGQFSTWAAQMRQSTPQPLVEGGLVSDVIAITVRVRDSARNRTIGNADRLEMQGSEFQVVNTGLPDRIAQTIELMLKRQVGG